MANDKNRILDLDDLLGQNKSVKVKWHTKEYALLTVEAISPKQAVQFQRMQEKTIKLQTPKANGDASKNADVTDDDAAQLEALVDEMLIMLCSELPIGEIPFGGKMRILNFYMEETQGKKALEVALSPPTGVTSSQS